MSEDREIIAMAVLDGQLPIDALTLEEVAEINEKLFDIVCQKHLPQNRTKMH
jgi:hypothetical protein